MARRGAVREGLGAEAPGRAEPTGASTATRAAGPGAEAPVAERSAADGYGLYYTALDALERTGTQPSVAEVFRSTSGPR